jgi:hypothetical protein
MKYVQSLAVVLTGSLLLSCGGGDTITRNDDNTGGETPMAILTSLNSTPENGNGLIGITTITSNVNQSGGDQMVRITGTTGPEDARILHQIEVHYHIYFVGGDTRGEIDMVTHSWGTTLSNSIDGGISVCESNCTNTEIHPTLNTLIFADQVLDTTANINMLQGTVVYPTSAPAQAE